MTTLILFNTFPFAYAMETFMGLSPSPTLPCMVVREIICSLCSPNRTNPKPDSENIESFKHRHYLPQSETQNLTKSEFAATEALINYNSKPALRIFQILFPIYYEKLTLTVAIFIQHNSG